MVAHINSPQLRFGAVAAATVLVVACGAEESRYPIGGSISGLTSAGLVLANNAESLAVAANGPFAFTPGLPSGRTYQVSVKVQPEGQWCIVSNGTGTVSAGPVTNVSVTCTVAAAMNLVSATPAPGATAVPRTVKPALVFSVPLNTPVISGNVTLQSAAGSHPLTALASGSALSVSPSRKLLPLTTYTLEVATSLRGAGGEQLPTPVMTAFTTEDGAWQPGSLLVPDTTDQTFDPRIALNPDGNAIALWRQSVGAEIRVLSRHYSVSTGWGPAMTVPKGGLPSATALVLDASDHALAVWNLSESYSCGEESTCTRDKLWTSRFSPQKGWDDPRLIASASNSPMVPKLRMNSSGDALLVWAMGDGSNTSIWTKRYDASRGWLDSERLVKGPRATGGKDVAVDEDGNAMVTWQQGAVSSDEVWSSRYTTGGGWSAPVRIENGDAQLSVYAAVAMNSNGKAAAIWQQYDGTGFNLWFNSFSAGTGWDTPVLVADYPENAINAVMAMDAGGNTLLVWQELFHEGLDFRVNIWARRRAADGGWETPVLLGNVAQAEAPKLVMDDSGNAILLWSQRETGPSSVWSQRYIPNVGWSVPVLMETDDAGTATVADLAINKSGDALAVWQQFDGPLGTGVRLHAYYGRFQ